MCIRDRRCRSLVVSTWSKAALASLRWQVAIGHAKTMKTKIKKWNVNSSMKQWELADSHPTI
jgi:hypothetical protein